MRFARPLRYQTLLPYGIAAALLAVFAGLFVESRLAAAQPRFQSDSGLIVSTRTDLRVCTDIRGPAPEQVTRQLIGALERVRRHPHWTRTGYGDAIPVLERDCAAVQLPDSGVAKGVVVGPGLTGNPSPYRTVIVVLDAETADRYLGDQPAVLVPYELMRVKTGVTAMVTQALVVRAFFLDSPEFAKEYLTPALGLHPNPVQEEDHHD